MNFDWMIDRVNQASHFWFFGVGLLLLTSFIAVALLRRSGYALTVEEQTGEKSADQRGWLRRHELRVRRKKNR